MRNLRRAYRRPDGGVSMVVPCWDDGLSGFGLTDHATEAEWYEWAVTHNIPADWVSLGDVDVAALPSRDFRNCWRHKGRHVHVDPTLETAERWVRIRKERNQLLSDSDGPMARTNEQGSKVQEWKTYRQALRDVPQQTDPRTIEWPVKPKHNVP